MTLVYITGISGTGKSSVAQALKKRGHEAYDVDAEGLAHWHDRETGETFSKQFSSAERTPAFNARYAWTFDRARIAQLAVRPRKGPAFVCGVAHGEKDIWDFFSLHIALVIDEATLERRIRERDTNDFGKSAHEWAEILGWYRGAMATYARIGIHTLDATQPLEKVVDDILYFTQYRN